MEEEFADRYTLANIPRNAALYQTDQFLGWLKRLEAVNVQSSMAVSIMVRDIRDLLMDPELKRRYRLRYLLHNGVAMRQQVCSKMSQATKVMTPSKSCSWPREKLLPLRHRL